MRTPEFTKLLDLLHRHPEFSADYDNDCDTEIIAYGKYLWARWEAAEVTDITEVDAIHSVDQLKLTNRVSPNTRSILQAVIDGLPAAEIRNKFSISATQLSQLKYKYGLTKKVEGVRNAANTKYHFDVEQLVKDLERLPSVKAVAKEYGVRYQTLLQYMKRHGITGKQTLAARITRSQIVEAVKSNKTQQDAADHLSISRVTFQTLLKHHGVRWESGCNAA
ncbi:hypothetical protein [Enterococcus sp. AZ136]|uniref:hypothetical protein n=1 Tax=Enterococcus sp. AZ136 TaxID=2774788 RepID=UPI003D2948C4